MLLIPEALSSGTSGEENRRGNQLTCVLLQHGYVGGCSAHKMYYVQQSVILRYIGILIRVTASVNFCDSASKRLVRLV